MKNKTNPKICAVICELNPPHNGHKFLFEKAKSTSGCDYLIAIMSGNYVQRGEPAIFSMETRAKMAIKIGADAVIIIPAEYSTSSAEIFAKAGVLIANSVNNITHLAFGIDDENFETINMVFTVIKQNKIKFNNLIKSELKNGVSYSTAKSNAVLTLLNNSTKVQKFFTANNILALEYLLSLDAIKSKIISLPISRAKNTNITSASDIRKMLLLNDYKSISQYVPSELLELYKDESICDYDYYNKYAMTKISVMSKQELKIIRDINEGLENAIYREAVKTPTLENFLTALTSKRYTPKRLKRIILSCCLNLKKIKLQDVKIDNLKLLAVKNDSVLKYISSTANLVVRANNIDFDISQNIDELSTRLYTNFQKNSTNSSFWTVKLLKNIN